MPILSVAASAPVSTATTPFDFHRGGGIDPVDRRMGVRRTNEIGVGLAWAVDVVDVVALAGDEADVFLAFDGGADACRAHDLSLALV